MTKREQLIKQANEMFKECDEIWSVPCPIHPKDIKWGDKGEKIAAYPNLSSSQIGETLQFSSYFWYQESMDMLMVWGRGLGILYWNGMWATRTKPVEKPIINYQIF